MTPTEITAWIAAAKGATDLMRSAWQIMPKGESKDKIEAKVAQAESALEASNAALAHALGYKLCQCTFPPQIMLWKQQPREFVCEKCGHKIVKPTALRVSQSNYLLGR